MRKTILLLGSLLLAFGLFGQEADYSIFLIGDAGENRPFRNAVLTLVTTQLQTIRNNASVVFLGDNIYPRGLPEESHPDRQQMENKLTPQLDAIKESGSRGFVIPGNHDWAKGNKDRWTVIKEQQEFITDYLEDPEVFLPKNGCPGPVAVELSDRVSLVILDTQWLLTGEEKHGNSRKCEFADNDSFYQEIDRIITSSEDRLIIFAAHHPVHTYGSHGGVYQLKQHIFPLTDLKKWLYFPLPVIGSVYPIYRSWIGNIQDATNARYRKIMQRMVNSFERHPMIIHAAGHEHALEYAMKNNVHFVVSGSGSKTEYVRKKKLAHYVSGDNGFARIDLLTNNEIWLEFWIVNDTYPRGTMDYRIRLGMLESGTED